MSNEKKIEDLKQENHQLKLKISSLETSNKTEVEYLREELQVKEADYKSREDQCKLLYKKKEKELQERISSLSEDLSQSREEISDLKIKIEDLHRSSDQLKSFTVDRHTFNEEYESMKVAVDQLNIELKTARSHLEVQQSRVHSLNILLEKQKQVCGELKEEIESRDICISQLQTKLTNTEKEKGEAISELQQLVMMTQTAEQESEDPHRRGNSLFSEVEERRVRVEEELKKLRERVARLTAQNYELQGNLDRGDSRSAIILKQLHTIISSEKSLMQDIKKLHSETDPLFTSYKDRYDALKKEYLKKLRRYKECGTELENLGELEELRADRDLLISQKMSLERELFENRRELKILKQQLTKSESICNILRTKLQALQEEVFSGSEKAKTPSSQDEVNGNNGQMTHEKWLVNYIEEEERGKKKKVKSEETPNENKEYCFSPITSSSQSQLNDQSSTSTENIKEEITGCSQQ